MSATSKSMSSIKEARELYELKERAAKFYAENGVPQKMEDILNTMFYDNPSDVYGHLANYFQTFAKPAVITKVRARTAVDGKCQNTIQTDVFCTVNNKEKLVTSSLNSSVSPVVLETGKPEELEEEAKERDSNVEAALGIINTQICTKLQGLEPTNQQQIDSIISGFIDELKASEEERRAKEAEEQGDSENPDTERKPGSSISKTEKPKSGKDKSGRLVNTESIDKDPVAQDINAKVKNYSSKRGRPVSKLASGNTAAPIGIYDDNPANIDSGSKGGKGPAVVVTPDEPREKLVAGSVCVSATSQALCAAGAATSGTELFEYIAALRFGEAPKQFRLPLPMVTIFQSGRAAPGKSNCIKEYMLVPKPGKPLSEAVPQIVSIYNDVVKAILGKNGGASSKRNEKVVARNVTDLGALMVSFDRPEQGLDLMQESLNRLGFTPGEDFYIALNLAGQEIFDYEKGKYEVIAGQQKVAEDMIDFWVDIVTRYPAIIAIIDPLRKQEDKPWMQICEKLSEKCYILGDTVWHRPGLLKDEELTEDFKSSGNVYQLEQLNTITDILECAKKMEVAGNETVLSTNVGETTDTFIADMAVGMNARFLKVGAPCRGERVSKLNRLVSIEVSLQDCHRLVPHGEFTFPIITVPIPPETEDGEPEEAEVKEPPKKK